MSLATLSVEMLPEIERVLQDTVAVVGGSRMDELHHMLAYHMGWEGNGARAEAAGKRIRPLVVLLSTAACGAPWSTSLPAAAGVELVHNFSLIHDDIEDESPTRRGRLTVWTKWGIAQAINAGDAMFSLAHQAVHGMEETASPKIALECAQVLLNACLQLTKGQYLDLSYENRRDLSVADYWPMVSGKTAALLGASTELGATAAGASQEVRETYRMMGEHLGLAFQAQDDLLGIWGDEQVTGKSSASDLVAGKNSLPVLYGLSRDSDFKKRWLQGPVRQEDVERVRGLLEEEGARQFTQKEADRLTAEALSYLDKANPQGEAGEALRELAFKLLKRNM